MCKNLCSGTYIAEEDLSSAISSLNKIKEKTSRLSEFPQRGRLVPELKDQGILSYREIIVTPWRVLYRISEKDVYILAVIDSRQNVEDILLKRFILK